MTGSILNDTKKVLGISESDTSFDLDVMMHINSSFSVLQQLGVGPTAGFMIESHSDEWDDYLDYDNGLNMVKSYIYLNVRMLFDPPTTSFLIEAMNKQRDEHIWRISTHREWSLDPVDPLIEEEVTDE